MISETLKQETYTGERNPETKEKEGKGKLQCPEFVYSGDWHRNKRHGRGKCKYTNLRIYDGEWRNDLYHGQGELRYEYYGTYKGQFVNGLKSGRGKEELRNGSFYDGEYRRDLFHGKGLLTNPRSKYRYDGEFKAGKKCGRGIESFHDGSQYSGSFKDGYKHGLGKYTKISGYIYEGEWQFGVRQGYGVEYNMPNDNFLAEQDNDIRIRTEEDQDVDSAELAPEVDEMAIKFLYEGDFWNNYKSGVGKLMTFEGDYYYGGFKLGKKNGVGMDWSQEEMAWELKYWDMGNEKSMIEKKFRTLPPYLDGYQQEIQKIHARAMTFTDKVFDGDHKKYYLLTNQQLMIECKVRPQLSQFLRIGELNSLSYFSHKIDVEMEPTKAFKLQKLKKKLEEAKQAQVRQTAALMKKNFVTNESEHSDAGLGFGDANSLGVDSREEKEDLLNHPKVMLGEVYDNQLVTFLVDLIRKKNHLRNIINFYSDHTKKFYAVWMHMVDNLILQKYPIAVDDFVPISEDGMNLFSDLENTKNCILPILEKVWSKYVYLNDLKPFLKGRYIDRIILAFLGAPCQKVVLKKPSNAVSEIEIVDQIQLLKKLIKCGKPDHLKAAAQVGGTVQEGDKSSVKGLGRGFGRPNFRSAAMSGQKSRAGAGSSIGNRTGFLYNQDMVDGLEEEDYWTYSYCYPRREAIVGTKSMKLNDVFVVKEVIQLFGQDTAAAVVLEYACDRLNTIEYNGEGNIILEEIKNIEAYSHYFSDSEDRDSENCHIVMEYTDFARIFEVVYVSNYYPKMRYNYLTVLRDKPNTSTNMTNYMAGKVSISIIQDHIPKSEDQLLEVNRIAEKSRASRKTLYNYYGESPNMSNSKNGSDDLTLPVRLILGRRSLLDERLRGETSRRGNTSKKKNQRGIISALRDQVYIKEDEELKEIKEKHSKDIRQGRVTVVSRLNKTANKSRLAQREEVKIRVRSNQVTPGREKRYEDLNSDRSGAEEDLGISQITLFNKTPFDSRIPGLRKSDMKIKYVAGKGQSIERNMQIEITQFSNIYLEQGKHILMVQLQNVQQRLLKIKKLRFHIIIQSELGTLELTQIIKPVNFMETVYTDAAIRKGEVSLMSEADQGSPKDFFIFQWFAEEEGIYSQVFLNRTSDQVWNQKLSFNLKNMEIIGVKNHRKPVNLRIKPKKKSVLLIQQINCADYKMIGGEGACFTERTGKV